MRYRSPVVRFWKNVQQAIVNRSLPLHWKKRSTQVHLEQNKRYEQHQAGGSHCNSSSHVGRKYNARADSCVSAFHLVSCSQYQDGRLARLNVVAGATDASRAMLL